MRNFLLAFFIFLIWSIFGIWYYSCRIKELCIEPAPIQLTNTVPEVPNFYIEQENGDILFQFKDKLKISRRNAIVQIPQNLLSFRDSIFSYLKDNQGKELLIQGLYKNNEVNDDGTFGMQRAQFMKDLLIDFGVDTDKITISGMQRGFEYQADGYYFGGVSMLLNTIPKDRLTDKEITSKTLYSVFASKTFEADGTLRQYAIDLKKHLGKHPGKTVQIIGHTDNVGEAKSNLWYGGQRAKQVKDYLISIGIDATKLSHDSKGETEPIADNATEEGRAKNRRTEIIVN